MMAQMQGLILYNEYIEIFDKLPAEDLKSLVFNAMLYNSGAEIGELTPMAELLWPLMTAKIDQTRKTYERRCQVNRELAEKRREKAKARRKNEAHGTDEHGDVHFSDCDEEQMNTDGADDIESALTPTEHIRTMTNTVQTVSNDVDPHTNTRQIKPTKTKTKTETETETETKTETKTVTEAEAEAQAVTEAETEPAAAAGVGIGGGTGVGGENRLGFEKPTIGEVRAYCRQYALLVDADRFYRYYDERGWQVRGEPIQSWRAMADHWQKLGEQQRNGKADAAPQQPQNASGTESSYDLDAFVKAAMEQAFDWEG